MYDSPAGTAEVTHGARLAREFERLSEHGRREFAQEMERAARQRDGAEQPQCETGTYGGMKATVGYTLQDGALRAINGAEELSLHNIEEAMRYLPWLPAQVEAGDAIREALTAAAKAILRNVPRSPLRTRALNCIIDCRMLANAAITFGGRF